MSADHEEAVQGDADRERLKRLFRVFTGAHGDGRSLVYEAVCGAIVNDDLPDVLDLLLDAPEAQRRPSLLFAAINLLLQQRLDAELAGYYAIHGGGRAVDARLVPAVAKFCREHTDQLLPILRERSTQTNEIRRSLALRLGFDEVRRYWPGRLALVEVGASAGLNLRFDLYSYRANGIRASQAGRSAVVVTSEVRGGVGIDLLSGTPKISSRLGIDQRPVDLSDPDARLWLEAFIWPEQIDELTTLRGAIELATSRRVEVVAADATTETAQILSTLPGREPVVVFTASLLSYLSTADRAAFVSQLDAAAVHRPVAWVFAEAPGLLATTDLDIPALRGPLARRNSQYVVGASLRKPGKSDNDRLLALADPYVRWLAPARDETDDFAWA
ncbi:hypothetical protein GCM10011575_47910 [Microlunatus endophyticus]|uniref:DUF2332 domain-containing protein n=1 Tax=Microlunatus endophyticus TaxID=1716077 RepID=A0A917SIG8_9ACTN|nr:hypothetical protein GCM10011575_47910 [Microlunatus endophyticus]